MKLELFWLSSLVAKGVLSSPTPTASNDLIVNLTYAAFQGAVESNYPGVISWYNLRFAAAPIGNLRWTAPVPIESDSPYPNNTVVVQATTPGPSCLQQFPGWSPGTSNSPQSEDCLILNVFKPTQPVSSSLPVIVQIHGGGYNLGNSLGTSDGSYLVSKSNNSIIYVSVQYRLGALGFLGAYEVRTNGTANAGLLDQRAALNWVQSNIATFGGDPTKVTILGGSAGGGSVSAQLILYGGAQNPPFRAAIAEFPWFQPFHNATILEKQYSSLLKESNCGNLACLRALSFSALNSSIVATLKAGYPSLYGYGDFYFGPTVDGTIIQNLPMTEYALGNFSRVPIITDHDALEGYIFSNKSINTQAEVFSDLKQVWPAANASFIQGLETLWPTSAFGPAYASYLQNLTNQQYFKALLATNKMTYQQFEPIFNNSQFWRRSDIFGDGFINCPTYQIASSAVKYLVPVWKLVYNSGVLFHGAVDNGVISGPSSFANPQQSASLQDYILSFVTTLNPGTGLTGQQPMWQPYSAAGQVLDVNLTTIAMAPDFDNSARCQFLLNNGAIVRN